MVQLISLPKDPAFVLIDSFRTLRRTSLPSQTSVGATKWYVIIVFPKLMILLTSYIATGDPALIHPFLTEISKDKRKSVDGDLDTGSAALHLAVRCASGVCVMIMT